jgi:DnaD/phage-associated family protein
MIHQNFWESETMAVLSCRQRLLFIGLISNADDQGRMRAHAALVRSTVFPFDDIPLEEINRDLTKLQEVNSIHLYEVNERRYIQVVNWWDYQDPQWAYPSDIPAPDRWRDRLRYREGNQVKTRNWKHVGGFTTEETEETEETEKSDDTSNVNPEKDGAQSQPRDDKTNQSLGKALPKDLPKDLPNGLPKATPCTHSVSVSISKITGGSTRARAKGVPPPKLCIDDSPNAFALYQSAGGILNKIAADQLADLIEEFEEFSGSLAKEVPGAQKSGDQWVQAAIQEAVGANAKISINYIKAILDRWRREGFKTKLGGKNGSNRKRGRTGTPGKKKSSNAGRDIREMDETEARLFRKGLEKKQHANTSPDGAG